MITRREEQILVLTNKYNRDINKLNSMDDYALNDYYWFCLAYLS